LAQHGVHEGGLAVVNMGDDGDITYRLGHRGAFPNSSLADGLWIGGRKYSNVPHSAAVSILSATRQKGFGTDDSVLN
jgi:hypothetical protein